LALSGIFQTNRGGAAWQSAAGAYNPRMERLGSVASILLVALILWITLGTIFLQLMSYSLAMHDTREFWIWVGEWIGGDLVLTAFLCRKEIAALVKRRPPAG